MASGEQKVISDEEAFLALALERLAGAKGRHAELPIGLTVSIGLARALDLLELHGWRAVGFVGPSIILRS